METEKSYTGIWSKIKCYIFLKLGTNIWPYVIVHKDYWRRPYGVSFTDRRDFPKLFKYDMDDMNDDLEVEIEKNQ